jgi:hypothetical protein
MSDELRRMSDDEILIWWNESVRAREDLAAAYEHVASEIPAGKPQICWREPAELAGALSSERKPSS